MTYDFYTFFPPFITTLCMCYYLIEYRRLYNQLNDYETFAKNYYNHRHNININLNNESDNTDSDNTDSDNTDDNTDSNNTEDEELYTIFSYSSYTYNTLSELFETKELLPMMYNINKRLAELIYEKYNRYIYGIWFNTYDNLTLYLYNDKDINKHELHSNMNTWYNLLLYEALNKNNATSKLTSNNTEITYNTKMSKLNYVYFEKSRYEDIIYEDATYKYYYKLIPTLCNYIDHTNPQFDNDSDMQQYCSEHVSSGNEGYLYRYKYFGTDIVPCTSYNEMFNITLK